VRTDSTREGKERRFKAKNRKWALKIYIYNGWERKRQFLFAPYLELQIPGAQNITSPTVGNRIVKSVHIPQQKRFQNTQFLSSLTFNYK